MMTCDNLVLQLVVVDKGNLLHQGLCLGNCMVLAWPDLCQKSPSLNVNHVYLHALLLLQFLFLLDLLVVFTLDGLSCHLLER